MISFSQLTEFVERTVSLQGEERDNRVFAWLADASVRASIDKNASFLIEASLKQAIPDAVNRCLNKIHARVEFGKAAFDLHAGTPALAAHKLTPHDVLYAFRLLLRDQGYELDEHGVLDLHISLVDEEGLPVGAVDPVPPPEPDPDVEVTDADREVLARGVKEVCPAIDKGLHDERLAELAKAEGQREAPRVSVLNTIRTRQAFLKSRPA
jgi:hypothetical protein